jgi:hypothetical protein
MITQHEGFLMRRVLIATFLLASSPLAGQTTVRLGGGATYGTDFMKDFIVEPINVRQSLSPTVTLAVLRTLRSGYRVGLEARYATGDQEVSTDGSTDKVAGLTTVAISLLADGPIRGALRWEAALGMLRYRPETESGVFSDGNVGPILVGAGASWSSAVGSTMTVVVSARYDFHKFSTPKLSAASYTGGQATHRAGIALALERSF